MNLQCPINFKYNNKIFFKANIMENLRLGESRPRFLDENDQWENLAPIPQYEEGLAPICAIKYKPEYAEVMSYFRAVLKAEEVSDRAFRLTQRVIKLNNGNYTAWYYRRKLLEELGLSLEDEMKWLQSEECGLEMEKSYQIWHHRRCIAEILGERLNLDDEMMFLRAIFDSDHKNYHAWSYRIWLIERFQLWTNELDFVDEMLAIDSENNSVWSYRYFILNKCPIGLFKQSAPGTYEFVKSEIQILLAMMQPPGLGNEAFWVYLKGMLCITDAEEEKSQRTNAKKVRMSKFEDILQPLLQQAEI